MTVYDSAAARDLLARTAGLLPTSTAELMAVLTEYRHALVALTASTDRTAACADSSSAPGARPAGGSRRYPRRAD